VERAGHELRRAEPSGREEAARVGGKGRNGLGDDVREAQQQGNAAEDQESEL
jgi:hypothetical protein